MPSVSNIYEKLMQDQMLPFIQSFQSSLLFGFREGYGTQHAFLCLAEACKKTGGFAGAVLTDLSKAFDFLNHELLKAYGFGRSALLLIHIYVTDRKQRLECDRVRDRVHSVDEEKPSGEYHRVQSWDPFCLTYT